MTELLAEQRLLFFFQLQTIRVQFPMFWGQSWAQGMLQTRGGSPQPRCPQPLLGRGWCC